MTNTIAVCVLIAFAVICIVILAVNPYAIGDSNDFLRDFVNHEFLNILGVVVAITLASAAQLHLALNGIEERHKKKNQFVDTRQGIRTAAFALIWLFGAAVLLVIVKPLLPNAEWISALMNGMAIFIVLWNVLVLVALTEAVFGIPSQVDDDPQ